MLSINKEVNCLEFPFCNKHNTSPPLWKVDLYMIPRQKQYIISTNLCMTSPQAGRMVTWSVNRLNLLVEFHVTMIRNLIIKGVTFTFYLIMVDK